VAPNQIIWGSWPSASPLLRPHVLVVIWSRIRIPDHFSTSLTIAEWNFMRFISISYTVAGRYSRHSTKWLRQRNESTTFWQRSSRHPDPNPDQSGNLDSNAGSLLVETDVLAEVCALGAQSSFRCRRYATCYIGLYGCWNTAGAVTVATAVYLDSLNTTSRYQKDAARLLGSFIVWQRGDYVASIRFLSPCDRIGVIFDISRTSSTVDRWDR